MGPQAVTRLRVPRMIAEEEFESSSGTTRALLIHSMSLELPEDSGVQCLAVFMGRLAVVRIQVH